MSHIIGDIVTIGSGSTHSVINIYALINATYPSGSVCTATNGVITLHAPDKNGSVVFGIPTPSGTPETWTISCTNGTDSDDKTVSITSNGQIFNISLAYIKPVLNDNSWTAISKVSKAGTGDTYWDVGDCKEITLNGQIGDYLTLNNATLCVFILNFNYPINKSTADNNIIWGGFKTALTGGKDIALCDSQYSDAPENGTKIFAINFRSWEDYGGWKGCDLRYGILGAVSISPSQYNSTAKTSTNTGANATQATIDTPVSNTLMAALPSDFRSVLRLWSRYIDYKGNGSNTNANCSAETVDAISLLTEYEIFGSRSYANQYEQNHQKQMAYYTAGNSKVKYKHNATNTACEWYSSSQSAVNRQTWVVVQSNGTVEDGFFIVFSKGLTPVFRT